MNTLVLPRMTEQIVDVYLDQSEEDEGAEQCMLVKSDPGLKQRYGCMVAPAVVDVAGKTTTSQGVQPLCRASDNTWRCGDGWYGGDLGDEGPGE